MNYTEYDNNIKKICDDIDVDFFFRIFKVP